MRKNEEKGPILSEISEYKNRGKYDILFYWCAPGAQSHLHVPRTTGSGKVCLKFIPRVTPLNAGELKV